MRITSTRGLIAKGQIDDYECNGGVQSKMELLQRDRAKSSNQR